MDKKITKKEKIVNEAEEIMGIFRSMSKASKSGYFHTFVERNRHNSELYSIADYQKGFDGFFNHKTLPISIENNLIIFELNDEIDYIRSQVAEELTYEHLYDYFFAKYCLVKIWSENLFYSLFNSIENSSITDKYGTKADDYDWNCSNFTETSRRSKYKESLFDKYNLKTFLDDAYLSNNRIYLKLEQKFAERLWFLVGKSSEFFIAKTVKKVSVEACREWIFSIPTEAEVDDYLHPENSDKQVDKFILDNRLIVNWEPAK